MKGTTLIAIARDAEEGDSTDEVNTNIGNSPRVVTSKEP